MYNQEKQVQTIINRKITGCFKLVNASKIDVAFEDCLFYPSHIGFPSNPCHLTLHPPDCIPILSKFLNNSQKANPLILMIFSPTKTTYFKNDVFNGKILSFFNSTKDSCTALSESSY